jgi:hypothetical protein
MHRLSIRPNLPGAPRRPAADRSRGGTHASPGLLLPLAEEGLALHLRLAVYDPVAPADVCRAYLGPLLAWLEAKYARVDPHLLQTAVHEALLGYVQRPLSYDPRRGDLAPYLRMAARADLFNLLSRESRHHQQRISWPAVEQDLEAGNLSRGEEDPADRLEREEEAEASRAILRAVEARCSEAEKRVLALMVAGERATTAYAEALGLAGLPVAEQEREVKKVKDRIKKRLERGGPSRG